MCLTHADIVMERWLGPYRVKKSSLFKISWDG